MIIDLILIPRFITIYYKLDRMPMSRHHRRGYCQCIHKGTPHRALSGLAAIM